MLNRLTDQQASCKENAASTLSMQAAKPPCQEEPSSPPKRQKISNDDEHHDMIDTMLHGGADDVAKVNALHGAKLKALERLLEGKSLTGMQPPSVPINVVTKSGALRVLLPDGSVTDDGPPTNDSAIVPFAGEGHGEDLLSDEEKTSFTAALKVGLDFMQKHYADAKTSLVELEQWSSLKYIQNAVDEMHACMTVTPSSRSTARCTMEWICKNLRVHPLLCPCANELSQWNCPPLPLQSVHQNLETHWNEVKALLVAKENWEVLRDLSSTREILASTVANGFIAENDRSLVRRSLQTMQDAFFADDPSVLHGVVWQ